MYSDWKRRVTIWSVSTKVEKKKMAATLICHMKGKPETAAIQLDITGLQGDDGVEKLIAAMDKLYEPDSTLQIFSALDEFLYYKRPTECTMEEYCREFNRKLKMLEQKSGKDNMFDDGVLAYFLLQNSNLDKSSMMLIRATVSDLKLALVEAALKKTFGLGTKGIKSEPSGLTCIKQEDVYFGRGPHQSSSGTDQSGYCSSATHETSTSASEDEERTYYTHRGRGSRFPYRTRGSGSGYQRNYRGHSGGSYRDDDSYRRSSKDREQYGDKEKNHSPDQEKVKKGKGNKKQFICFYCGEEGHKIADCPERKKGKEKRQFL